MRRSCCRSRSDSYFCSWLSDNLNYNLQTSQYLYFHLLVETLELHLHQHRQVVEQRVPFPVEIHLQIDATAFVYFLGWEWVHCREGDFGLQSVLDEHQSGILGIYLSYDRLLGLVPVFEELVGVVVRWGSGRITGHSVPHVHLVTDLGHFNFVDCINTKVLMKAGRGYRSMAAASSLCTKTSAYLLMGEVKWV